MNNCIVPHYTCIILKKVVKKDGSQNDDVRLKEEQPRDTKKSNTFCSSHTGLVFRPAGSYGCFDTVTDFFLRIVFLQQIKTPFFCGCGIQANKLSRVMIGRFIPRTSLFRNISRPEFYTASRNESSVSFFVTFLFSHRLMDNYSKKFSRNRGGCIQCEDAKISR